MSKKFLKITYITLTVLVMVTIFLFSNQNGYSSDKISSTFTLKNSDIISIITFGKVDFTESFPAFHHFIRKFAHVFLFFLLSVFSFLSFKSFNLKSYYSIIFCLIYAASDELHQFFVPGRSAAVKDVFIDMIGVITAFFLLKILFKRKPRDGALN